MTTTTRFSLSDDSKEFIQTVFGDMMEACHGITGLLISTVDGHVVTALFREQLQENRLSAMTSSLLALAESLAREAHQDVCRYIIVQNADGVLVTQRFGKALVLTSIADQATNLGMLHSVTRAGVARLGDFKRP